MTNFEALKKMSAEELAAFLDYVYCTGLNTGTYSASLDNESDEKMQLLDEFPYDIEWLNSPAEDATRLIVAEDGDAYLPNAFVKATLRSAGISEDNIGEENEDN